MPAVTAMARAHDSVAGYLSADHDRLDGLLAAVCKQVETRQLEEACATLAEFASGLSRHIRIEEEILFPILEMRTSRQAGPTLVMRSEHREILAAVRGMSDGLAQLDVDTFGEGLALLRQLLPAHNAKEELILYSEIERVFSDAERPLFVERLRRELT